MSLTPVSASPGARRIPLKQIAIALGLVALGAFAAFAFVRESRMSATTATSAPGNAYAGVQPQVARTPAEEKYAAELWTIHENVKASAVRMAFTGLKYKMGELEARDVKTQVAPLVTTFEQAKTKFDGLQAPESLKKQHDLYSQALRGYVDSSKEMIRVAADGKDEHLIKAQALSYAAAENLLRVGDALWPGENRPN